MPTRVHPILATPRSAPAVKVCCIASRDEVELALLAGATMLGLVSAMPSGPGVIDDATIASLVAHIGDRAVSVLLTSRTEPEAIAAQLHASGARAVQLVDALTSDDHAALARLVPEVLRVQVIHVRGPSDVDDAIALAPAVDALLLDSGNPSAATPTLGGTGRTHDWALSEAIVDGVEIPVLLAGGLHAENIGRAIARVRPWGVDVCSGVRTAGALDAAKLSAFVGAAR
ncbi:MAG: phosphoribosylanthranilate isomerase [Gemmatimonadaceae bacterium]|nr:phosphoribosylanthranilate isomerase [Gemmatimonadaceae bacterium]